MRIVVSQEIRETIHIISSIRRLRIQVKPESPIIFKSEEIHAKASWNEPPLFTNTFEYFIHKFLTIVCTSSSKNPIAMIKINFVPIVSSLWKKCNANYTQQVNVHYVSISFSMDLNANSLWLSTFLLSVNYETIEKKHPIINLTNTPRYWEQTSFFTRFQITVFLSFTCAGKKGSDQKSRVSNRKYHCRFK